MPELSLDDFFEYRRKNRRPAGSVAKKKPAKKKKASAQNKKFIKATGKKPPSTLAGIMGLSSSPETWKNYQSGYKEINIPDEPAPYTIPDDPNSAKRSFLERLGMLSGYNPGDMTDQEKAMRNERQRMRAAGAARDVEREKAKNSRIAAILQGMGSTGMMPQIRM